MEDSVGRGVAELQQAGCIKGCHFMEDSVGRGVAELQQAGFIKVCYLIKDSLGDGAGGTAELHRPGEYGPRKQRAPHHRLGTGRQDSR